MISRDMGTSLSLLGMGTAGASYGGGDVVTSFEFLVGRGVH